MVNIYKYYNWSDKIDKSRDKFYCLYGKVQIYQYYAYRCVNNDRYNRYDVINISVLIRTNQYCIYQSEIVLNERIK